MQNIYEYFVQFQRAAKHANWPQSRIDAVLEEARRGDYADALAVIGDALTEIEAEVEEIKNIRF